MGPFGQQNFLGHNPTREILLEFEKMKTRFDNLQRNGEVSDVKYDKEKKRWFVKYKEEGHDNPFETSWRPWKSFSHGAISVSMPPRKGMKATMHSPGGYPEQSYVEAYHYGPDTPSPHDQQDEAVIQIQKPKSNKEQSSGSSDGTAGSGSTGSSRQDQEEGGPNTPNNDDSATLRVHAKHDGYILTVGKVGKSDDASASNGDGSDGKTSNTFQMTIGRESKTITCGKFKAVIGKDGAKMQWGDKVSWELKDGQIESTVDGAKHTLTKDNIVAMLGGSSHTLTDGDFKVAGGTVHHDDRNIGKGHVHAGVKSGAEKTGQPDP